MKCLLDVCAGGRLGKWLRSLGYDVAEVRNANPSMTDEEVLAWAAREQRIVVTVDKDFGQLAAAEGRLCCVIIRLPDVPFAERKRVFTRKPAAEGPGF